MLALGFSLNLLTILAIVLSVGLVVDDAIVVVENVERHVRMGKSRVQAALAAARELVGPIIAMTITLAAVYAPIGFQGGLTGSLFLEFAITLAAAVVVSGVVAVTLSPVMSSRFVHAHGREGRLTALVNRGFEAVRRAYARAARRGTRHALGDRGRRSARHDRGLAALLVLATRARTGRGPEPHQPLPRRRARFDARGRQPRLARGGQGGHRAARGEFMWSLIASWGGFGGMVAKNWKERERSTEEMYGQVYGSSRRSRAARLPAPRPAAADARPIRRRARAPERRPIEELLGTAQAVVGAGYQSASSCTSTPTSRSIGPRRAS
jgi:multidrug efflux pump